MTPAGEFDGDEFSNNLVSDLAPLLALFGEQVTTQFLGMSVGWADNILLAMGPLGIITILISAIRIGGGRRLKSLVGRARETQAVAEKDLLSSTSASVCELWNGEQVTRLIGEPTGMMTVVAARDGEIHTLREAFKQRIITTDKSSAQIDNVVQSAPNVKEFLNFEANEGFLDLPPNLSLNARSKPVSPFELWAWAVFGTFLQASALAFPAIATYYFGWNKGEIPVAGYGYPCFVVGTVTLTIGIMLCGHIIEGATLETDFMLTQLAKKQGLRIVCLQEAFTIGDQQYPSCAIFLAEEDGILRTSRRGYLKHGHTWSRATATTVLTISGYIAQFVGLRALHWSATLVQVAVTLIMTGIRALARRSLASDPKTSDSMFKSHFNPWLTLLLRFEAERKPAPNCTSHGFRRRFGSLLSFGHDRRADFEKNQFFCELISDHSEMSGIMISWLNDSHSSTSSGPYTRDKTGYIAHQLLQGIEGPVNVSVEFRTGSSVEDSESEKHYVGESLRTHAKIDLCIHETNARTEDNDYQKASIVLCEVIEEVMKHLSATQGLTWKKQIKELLDNDKRLESPLRMCWGFDIREGRVSEYHQKEASQRHCRVMLQRVSDDNRWSIEALSRSHLQAIISLSLYTNAARIMYTTGKAHISTSTTPGQGDQDFRRIVGCAGESKIVERKAELQDWLEYDIKSETLSNMREEDDAQNRKKIVEDIGEKGHLPGFKDRLRKPFTRPEMTVAMQLRADTAQLTKMLRKGVRASYLGMFLSSSGDVAKVVEENLIELYIERWSNTTKALHYAQELFSLFVLALVSEVKSVNKQSQSIGANEDSTIDEQKRSKTTDEDKKNLREYPIFKDIAKIVKEKGLAQSMAEAYVLIIPAFAKYGLLPKDEEKKSQMPTDDQDPADFPIPL